jgi:SOS-response transcriptional repressor LexA
MLNTKVKLANMETTIRLYCFIVGYIREHGIPPTQQEMAAGCYVATGTVNRHLDRLHMWGYIERLEHTSRGVKLGAPAPFDCDKA